MYLLTNTSSRRSSSYIMHKHTLSSLLKHASTGKQASDAQKNKVECIFHESMVMGSKDCRMCTRGKTIVLSQGGCMQDMRELYPSRGIHGGAPCGYACHHDDITFTNRPSTPIGKPAATPLSMLYVCANHMQAIRTRRVWSVAHLRKVYVTMTRHKVTGTDCSQENPWVHLSFCERRSEVIRDGC